MLVCDYINSVLAVSVKHKYKLYLLLLIIDACHDSDWLSVKCSVLCYKLWFKGMQFALWN